MLQYLAYSELLQELLSKLDSRTLRLVNGLEF